MAHTLACASVIVTSLLPLALHPISAHAANNPAVTFMESGTDATQDLSLYASTTGAISSDATMAKTGPRSVKTNTGGSAIAAAAQSPTGSLKGTAGRVSFYFNMSQLPVMGEDMLSLYSGASFIQAGFGVTTGHNIYTAGGATGPTTLSTGTWYRISVGYSITSTSVNQFSVYLNGNLEASASNVTLFAISADNFRIGAVGPDTTDTNEVMHFDDIYADNGSDLSDPGDIRVTNKRPNAAGALNNFTTQIGAGGSGYGTGHSPQVNEQPLSTTNGWSMNVANTRENYAIEGATSGDVDVSAKAIVADEAWVDAKTSAGCAGYITNNGTDTAITLTTSAAMYTNAVNIQSYPSNAATVGVQSCTSTQVVSLYESGMLIGFLGSSGTATESLTSGGYSVLGQGTIAFPATTLTGVDQTLSQSGTGYIDFSDASGSGLGWNITAQLSTVFTNGGNTLPLATVTLASRTPLTCDAGSSGCIVGTDGLGITYPKLIPTTPTAASKIFNAAVDTGLGNQGFGNAQTWVLGGTIPANARALAYTATITYTMAGGV